MRSRRKRTRKDAKQVSETLQNTEVEWVTLEQVRTLVNAEGRPISTDIRDALGVLADENRIKILCEAELIESIPEKNIRFRYED